jgi:hypothetical protein
MAKAVMTITIEDNGTINVTGPIQDKILAYGMLESAKDAVREFLARQAAGDGPRIAIPSVRMPNPNGGLKG